MLEILNSRPLTSTPAGGKIFRQAMSIWIIPDRLPCISGDFCPQTTRRLSADGQRNWRNTDLRPFSGKSLLVENET
jgi:hypothetical protein